MASSKKSDDSETPDAADISLQGRALFKLVAVVTFGPFLAQLDTTVVNVALSTLSTELNAPLATIQWVATGYLLALALMIPLCGWLVDCVGAKRLYVCCFALFTASSMLCGFSTSANQLIACRVLQGMAGGLLAPMVQLMVARYAGQHMAKALSLVTVPVFLAPIFGPSLAGAVLHVASWHWIFFVNVPVGILAIGLAIWLLPADSALKPRRLDWVGFLLISPGLVLLLDGFNRLATASSSKVLDAIEIGVAIALLGAFVYRGLRQKGPGLIDLRLFGQSRFTNSAMTQFLANAIMQGGQMLVPLYLLTARDFSPATVGLVMAPMGIGLLVTRPFIDRLLRRFGPRRVSVSGAVISFLATLLFALPGIVLPAVVIAAALLIRGMGMSLINLPSVVSAYTTIPRESLTDAATAFNIVQRLGGPLATMALALLLQYLAGLNPVGVPNALPESSFHVAFAALCLITLTTVASAARLPRQL